jgi:hypothetical protein
LRNTDACWRFDERTPVPPDLDDGAMSSGADSDGMDKPVLE